MSIKRKTSLQMQNIKLNGMVYTTAVDIKWLGLCWDDIQTLELPPQAYQPLTARDRRKIDTMLESECVKVQRFTVRSQNINQK